MIYTIFGYPINRFTYRHETISMQNSNKIKQNVTFVSEKCEYTYNIHVIVQKLTLTDFNLTDDFVHNFNI